MKSEASSIKLTQRLLDAGYPDISTLSTWEPSKLLPAPSFPSFFSLVAEDASSPTSTSAAAETSLFKLLVSDPRSLYYEFLEDPSRFDQEATELIQLVGSGAMSVSSLTSDQLQILDRATMAMMEPRHRAASPDLLPSLESSSGRPAIAHLLSDDEDQELEYTDEGRLVPLDNRPPARTPDAPPTFWWRK